MSGKFYLNLLILVLMVGCGAQQEQFEERAKVERITALIDAKNYDAIIQWYESTPASERREYARYHALAKLGKGGFDPISMIPKILAPQAFPSYARSRLFGDCDNRALKSFNKPEIKCLMLRMMNQLPDPTHPDLLEGRQLLSDMSARGELSSADYTLLLLVETSLIVKRVGSILETYLELGDDVTDEQLHAFYAEIEKATLASQQWIENMERSPEEVSKRITGLSKVSIMQNLEGKTRFLKKTGIPYVLDNIKPDNRDSVAIVSRVFFIQVIDTVLQEYFGIEN